MTQTALKGKWIAAWPEISGRTAFFFAVLLLSSLLKAQTGQHNNWYFGNTAGVTFASGSPVAVTNGALVTTEGCASISDAAGNLLFYTNGITVWNRNHLVMTNGTALNGHASSTQSAIIVPKPGTTNVYYIFTADADVGPDGIQYSEVNMSLSAGLGAVTAIKNVPLITPSCEKLTAVRHCNNRDIWVISHDWNSSSFRTWLITSGGVNLTPVMSTTGTNVSGIVQSSFGQLKANRDGNKLIGAYYGFAGNGVNKFEAYDFNNSTGVVSNGILLCSETGMYGCEFSPNGRMAYGSTNQGRLVQYDLCAGTTAAIQASRYVIGNFGAFIGSLQAGPDNKIYVSRNTTSLSVINSPNSSGVACGYVNAAVSLAGKVSSMGLPNIASFYLRPPIPPFTNTANCLNVNFVSPTVNVSSNSCANAANAIQGVNWNFGDPGSGASNTSTTVNPSHTFSAIGTYSVRLILNLGCYFDTIIQPITISGFNITTASTVASCGASNGTATATPAVAGTYTYAWSSGATSQTATGLAAGIYTVTVTSGTGCVSTASVTVASGGSIALTINKTNVSCFGTSTGSATGSVTGGTAPFTYSWSTAATGATVNGLTTGNYTCTVTDASGCTATQSFTITQPAGPLAGTVTVAPVSCGGGTGSASVIASGGTSPYTYSWSGGGTGTSVTGLANGNYSVTITDSRGCTVNKPFTISQPAALGGVETVTNVLCNGAANGTATTIITGGTLPYTYLWSNAATSPSINGLTAGIYSVTITDANGCTLNKTGTITQPVALTATTAIIPATCSGIAASATVAPAGGVAPYTYVWTNGATTQTVSNLASGSYSVTVRDANNCTVVKNITINSSASLTVTTTISQITCNGAANGSVQANVSGGAIPYSYSWSSGPATSLIQNLGPATYTVTVTDAAGCIGTSSAVITQPAGFNLTTSSTQASCGASTGTATATPSVAGTYTYAWSNGAATQTATGLSGGIYTVTVTSAAGCPKTASVTVSSGGSVSLAVNTTNASCFGSATGSATGTVTGGTAPFVFTWSSGASGATANGLAAGNYTVTVTDASGCTASQSFTISQPAQLAGTVTVAAINCSGGTGSASIAVTGGTIPYSYSWSSGGTGTSVTGLANGNYSVTITDSRGCSINKPFTISTPSALAGSVNVTNILCNGSANGAATTAITGGTTPYTYLWSNSATTSSISGLTPGNYSVTITDATGCTINRSGTIAQPVALTATTTVTPAACSGTPASATANPAGGTAPYTYTWTSGSTSQTATNLASGNYSVTVKDANNCSVVANVTISSPATISLSTTITQITCNGAANGSVQANVTGGIAPYAYSWSSGQTSAFIQNLAPGNYTVTVTDAAGCSGNSTAAVTQPAGLSLTTSSTAATCGSPNGSVSVNVAGTGTYTYSWNCVPVQTTSAATGLNAGSYVVTVTNASGCSNTATASVANTGGLNVSANINSHVGCFGDADGSATALANGGTTPYIYSWTNGTSNPTANSLIAGTYTVTVTDGTGCSAGETIIINEPSAIIANVVTTPISCFGASDGTATINVSGGAGSFTYSWSNGANGPLVSNLGAGAFTVNVIDINNCLISRTVSMIPPPQLLVQETHTNIACAAGTNGSISLSASGGLAPYTASWTNGSSGMSVGNFGSGTYSYTVTDASGCSVSGSVTLTAPGQMQTVAIVTPVTCYGSADGEVDLTISGGIAPYAFSWDNAATTEDITGLAAGTYNAVITDSMGCTASATANITEPDSLSFTYTVTPSACNGSTGSLLFTAAGAVSPYQFSLDSSAYQPSPYFGSLTAGIHNITIRDAAQCELTRSVIVPSPAGISVQVNNIQDVTCAEGNDGGADAVVVGGMAPYGISWSSGEAGPTANQLNPGTQYVNVTDAAGCTASLTFEIAEPAPLTLVTTITPITCYAGSDGSVSLQISGGSGAYNILWETGATGAVLSAMPVGYYDVEIRDGNNCLLTDTILITQPLQPIMLQTTVSPGECGTGGGNITVLASGGTGSYSYSWNTSPAQTDPIAGDLPPGTYTVTVTDANGCSNQSTATLSSFPPITASIDSVEDVTCYGGNNGHIAMTITGGSAPYIYQWGEGPQSSLPDSLIAGTYTMTVIDNNGCMGTANFTIAQPQQLTAVITPENLTCFESGDGRTMLTVNGGTQPYNYQWSNGIQTSANNDLQAGPYSCMITDAAGCQVTDTAVVTQPAQLNVALTIQQPGCNGNNNGEIHAAATGGTGLYNYQWSTGSVAPQIEGLGEGSYTVNVIDENACLTQEDVDLVSAAAFTIFTEGDTLLCQGQQSIISASVGGTHDMYSFVWDHGVNGASFAANPQETATYTVTVTDSVGCVGTKQVTVHVNSLPEVAIIADDTSGCAPMCVKLLAVSSTAVNFKWTISDGTSYGTKEAVHCFNLPGVYGITVEVSDAQFCRTTFTWNNTIDVHAAPEAAFLPTPPEATLDNSTIGFTDQSQGGTHYTYYFGDPNQSMVMLPNTAFTYNDTGSFEVTLQVENDFGCTDEAVQTIHIGGFTAFYLPKAFSPNNDGLNDTFLPKASGLASSGFEMRIFDRWGEEIFFTNDWDKGWDGTYKGKPVAMDMYTCKVKYFDKTGNSNDLIEAVTVTE